MEPAVEPVAPSQPERGPTAGDPSAARSLHHSTVVTPEGVVLEFRAAGVGSRMLAKGIDLLIQFAGVIAAILIGLAALAIGEGAAVVTIVVLLFGIFYGYPAVLETWWDGRTVGKRVLRIRVITVEGGPVTFRHSAIRAMLETVDLWLPTPGGLVALCAALATRRSQRLGDLAAGTIVVREPRASPSPVYFPPAFGAEGLSSTLDTSRLEAHQYTLVREYLIRAGDLLAGPRLALGEALAARVADVIGIERPAGLDAERYLVSVLVAHQRRWAGPPGPPGPTGAPSPPPGSPPLRSVPPGVDLRALPPPAGRPVTPGR